MIAIINYGAGNMQSVQNALEHLDQKYFIANTPEEIHQAEKIILPGVGAAGPAMQKLRETGFAQYLQKTTKPVLGICLGMQLLADYSEEGSTECLGVIPGKVQKFDKTLNIKIPHMGWNTIHSKLNTQNSKLYYFVHSYYFDTTPEYIRATCSYGIKFPCIIQNKNFTGMQFHPEKSGDAGLTLLKNWLEDDL